MKHRVYTWFLKMDFFLFSSGHVKNTNTYTEMSLTLQVSCLSGISV